MPDRPNNSRAFDRDENEDEDFIGSRSSELKTELENSQKSDYTKWTNRWLRSGDSPSSVEDIFADFSDGMLLAELLRILTKNDFNKTCDRSRFKVALIMNVDLSLAYLREHYMHYFADLNASSIVEQRPNSVLRLIWHLIIIFGEPPEQEPEEDAQKDREITEIVIEPSEVIERDVNNNQQIDQVIRVIDIPKHEDQTDHQNGMMENSVHFDNQDSDLTNEEAPIVPIQKTESFKQFVNFDNLDSDHLQDEQELDDPPRPEEIYEQTVNLNNLDSERLEDARNKNKESKELAKQKEVYKQSVNVDNLDSSVLDDVCPKEENAEYQKSVIEHYEDPVSLNYLDSDFLNDIRNKNNHLPNEINEQSVNAENMDSDLLELFREYKEACKQVVNAQNLDSDALNDYPQQNVELTLPKEPVHESFDDYDHLSDFEEIDKDQNIVKWIELVDRINNELETEENARIQALEVSHSSFQHVDHESRLESSQNNPNTDDVRQSTREERFLLSVIILAMALVLAGKLINIFSLLISNAA